MCDITFSCVSDPKAARDVSASRSSPHLVAAGHTRCEARRWRELNPLLLCAAGVGTQRRAAGHPTRQVLRGDVDRRPGDHHRTLAGFCPHAHNARTLLAKKCLPSLWPPGNQISGRTVPGGPRGRKPADLQRRDVGHPGSRRQDGVRGLQQLLPGHGQDLLLPG